jgi:hypothetical protein
VAGVFIFAQPGKERLPQFGVARLRGKIDLRRKQRIQAAQSLQLSQ